MQQPRLLKHLYKEIYQHPNYPTLSPGTRFAFECGILMKGSWREVENRKWARQLWDYLYLNKWAEEFGQC